MLFGLGIGLIVALGVYLNDRTDLQSPVAAILGAAPREQALPASREAGNDAPTAAPVESEPEPAPVSDAVAAPQRDSDEDPDRFSFYDVLPSFEVVIPEIESPAPRTETLTAIAEPGIYVLQAGSFLTQADAEAQRARLALLGIESRIQRVTIDDRAFHRVRVGPLEELDEVNSIRRRLADAQIESMVMRIAQ